MCYSTSHKKTQVQCNVFFFRLVLNELGHDILNYFGQVQNDMYRLQLNFSRCSHCDIPQ